MRALSSSGICVEVRAETVLLDIANNSSVKGDRIRGVDYRCKMQNKVKYCLTMNCRSEMKCRDVTITDKDLGMIMNYIKIKQGQRMN